MRILRVFWVVVAVSAMIAMPIYAAVGQQEDAGSTGEFGSMKDADGGHWIDRNNLTWKSKTGEVIIIGSGLKYSAVYPGVTDRECILREKVSYNIIQAGEIKPDWNSAGEQRMPMYDEEELRLVKEFVNSFDWINSDELTRVKAVWNRIANGESGNTYGMPKGGIYSYNMFPLLKYKVGVCEDFATEFQRLATYIGLDCVKYNSSVSHTACLVKVNGQWITFDPTGGGSELMTSYPVDYEMEYNRSSREYAESDEGKRAARFDEINTMYQNGEITYDELEKKINELYK